MEKWWTLQEISEDSGYRESAIGSWIRSGELKAKTKGGKYVTRDLREAYISDEEYKRFTTTRNNEYYRQRSKIEIKYAEDPVEKQFNLRILDIDHEKEKHDPSVVLIQNTTALFEWYFTTKGYTYPQTISIKSDDPASAARTLRKHMSPEDLTKLVDLLATAVEESL